MIADASWWLMDEEIEGSQSRRSGAIVDGTMSLRKFTTYKCPNPAACDVNNTCKFGLTDVACGRCPPNHVLNLGVCSQCPEHSPGDLAMWRGVFCGIGLAILSVAWFFLCWAPVFGETANSYFSKWFGWYDYSVLSDIFVFLLNNADRYRAMI